MSRPPASAATALAVENNVATAAPDAGSALAQDNNTAADYYNLSYSHCARPCQHNTAQLGTAPPRTSLPACLLIHPAV